jgi:hypothetical protein
MKKACFLLMVLISTSALAQGLERPVYRYDEQGALPPDIVSPPPPAVSEHDRALGIEKLKKLEPTLQDPKIIKTDPKNEPKTVKTVPVPKDESYPFDPKFAK